MSVKPTKTIEVFFSYSHKDVELRDELEKHLSILKRQGVIESWHDRRIGAGREWKGDIDKHLNTADVILLLISADFLASDYCYDVEMERAMERHEAGEARVIPVILRPVDWKGAPFGKLQALPRDAKPVTEWPNHDKALLDVARGIRAAVKELVGPSAGPPSSIGTAPVGQKMAPDSPPLAKPRQSVNWKKWGSIAGVIGMLIALLVPDVTDFLSTWLTKTPTVTPTSSSTYTPVISTVTPTSTPFPSTATPTFTPVIPTPTSKPVAGATMVWEKDGSVIVYVPAGEFTMGSDERSEEQPVHTVYLDNFWIDKYEVTNEQFTRFVAATGYQTEAERLGRGWVWKSPKGEEVKGAHWRQPHGPDSSIQDKMDPPVVLVSWGDANVYCQWAGKRLPTEAEWEKAARGTDERKWPWGNTFDASRLNFCDRNCEFTWKDTEADDGHARTAPVGSFLAGGGPYGALDMAGNVWEWVADWYNAGCYKTPQPEPNPPGPNSGEYRVIRGGSWFIVQGLTRCAYRTGGWPQDSYNDIGFRCAKDPHSAGP
jgi:formylglycine-generating enzyme required for sulfatase activity